VIPAATGVDGRILKVCSNLVMMGNSAMLAAMMNSVMRRAQEYSVKAD
jgi:hypothetical protein